MEYKQVWHLIAYHFYRPANLPIDEIFWSGGKAEFGWGDSPDSRREAIAQGRQFLDANSEEEWMLLLTINGVTLYSTRGFGEWEITKQKAAERQRKIEEYASMTEEEKYRARHGLEAPEKN